MRSYFCSGRGGLIVTLTCFLTCGCGKSEPNRVDSSPNRSPAKQDVRVGKESPSDNRDELTLRLLGKWQFISGYSWGSMLSAYLDINEDSITHKVVCLSGTAQAASRSTISETTIFVAESDVVNANGCTASLIRGVKPYRIEGSSLSLETAAGRVSMWIRE